MQNSKQRSHVGDGDNSVSSVPGTLHFAFCILNFALQVKKQIVMKKPVKILLAAFLATALFSCGNQAKQEDATEVAQEQNEQNLENKQLEQASDFVVKAADAGIAEVQLGKLAAERATKPEVKKFAQTMVEEHTRANDELKAIAQQQNIVVPSSISEENQEKMNKLQEKQGEEFDKEYMDMMVKDHKKVVDMFEKQAENGDVPEVSEWASNKVPALRHHLEMAQSTEDAIDQERN